ncbi:MAG: hypothetical protein CM1200mP26_13620 [Acidimicrobiales bacterium]|nr:MAG: hypothetical protein CM1200mP26_13620 [Acidimicrobiales bacterium]
MDFKMGGDRLLFPETLRDVLDDFLLAGRRPVLVGGPNRSGRRSVGDPGWYRRARPARSRGTWGLGMDEVDQVLLLEELGRAACPGPVAEHSAVAVPMLRDLAPSSVCDEWLGRAADGSAVLTAGSPGPYL